MNNEPKSRDNHLDNWEEKLLRQAHQDSKMEEEEELRRT